MRETECVCAFRLKTDKTVDQSCTGEAMLWASDLQSAPPPSLFSYRMHGKGREGTSGRRAAAEQFRSLSGSSVEHTKTLQQPAAPTKQLCILLRVLTGPSPLNQKKPGCSSPCLHPPLLDWLSVSLTAEPCLSAGMGWVSAGKSCADTYCTSAFMTVLFTDCVSSYSEQKRVSAHNISNVERVLLWETAASVSNNGSFILSGPLTQLSNSDAVPCTNAHTSVDKHRSMFVYMCVFRGSVNPLQCSPSFGNL